METLRAELEVMVGRELELRRLRTALRKRQSQLIWGAADAGKTFLIKNAISELPEHERRKCVCWTGPASRRQLVAHLIGELYLAGDPLVRKKVHADGAGTDTLTRWVSEQSSLRLRGILFTAAERSEYRFFIDHLPQATQAMSQLMNEIVYRTKTPIYLTSHGHSQGELGGAWSLYWTDEFRIRVGPLAGGSAREILETCIRTFRLSSFDLEGFREQVLHLSGCLPGCIVKMCELAADPRYRYGDQIKVKLVHVDYLMQGNRAFSQSVSGHSA
jgi:hypothetical protein